MPRLTAIIRRQKARTANPGMICGDEEAGDEGIARGDQENGKVVRYSRAMREIPRESLLDKMRSCGDCSCRRLGAIITLGASNAIDFILDERNFLD